MSDQDYFRLALGEIEDDLKNDFKSGLGFGLKTGYKRPKLF